GADFVARNLPQLELSAQRILGWLYEELFAPLADYLPAAAQAQPLVIVPHGVLHQVPFHALFDGQRYLLESYEISYAPSATTYALCAAKGSRPAGHALVLGVADSRIPFVVEEVAAVSTALANSRTFLNESATYSALQGVAPGCRLLHLACHGLFRGDNPMFSALQLHDHWVTANELMALDLDGALVTLSACESGRSNILAGDEIIGLTRAFLGAGAATLVASLWLVEDESTARLMSDWYRRMPDASRAAALRQAQLALKETHSHPYYWAPFVLVGQRGEIPATS
ncbi:MAG: CHAT domain-containing protein, partial [Anaerolineales bacterium]|nr:CHAT domain-containing protein [Anaerolineales bacterium]